MSVAFLEEAIILTIFCLHVEMVYFFIFISFDAALLLVDVG